MSFDPAWEEIHSQRAWGAWPAEHLVRYVMRTFQDPSGLRALDLGCGAGAQSFFLVKQGFTVTGIDGSPSAIRRCFNHPGPGHEVLLASGALEFRVSDVCELPWQHNTFDLVVDVACLQHVVEQDRALREAVRVLKPGGRFFSYALRCGTSQQIVDRMPVHAMSMHQVNQLYSDIGLEISIDTAAHTDNGGELDVKHWIITGRKP